jgi:hypothetical protein
MDMMRQLLLNFTVAIFVFRGRHAVAQSLVFSSTNNVSQNPVSLVAADVNGDGKMDLVSGQYGYQTLTVLTNNGNGTFSPCSTNGPSGGAFEYSVVAGDFNQDGKVDLVSLHEASPKNLTLLTNDGTGIFSAAKTLNTAFPPTSICGADVNGDGYPDLIVAHGYFAAVSIFTNDGAGNLVLSATNSVGTGPNCMVAVDVNGDKKADLITANQGVYPTYVGSITVLTNTGSGIFVANATYAMPYSLSSIVAADVNGDGYPDLIAASRSGVTSQGVLIVLTNNGSGNFSSNAVYLVGQGTSSLAAADMNGDGKVDLICANAGDNNVMVLTNDGRGNFTIACTNCAGPSPGALVVADVNGDGKPDVISANSGPNNTLTVLLNSPLPPSLAFQVAPTNTLNFSWSAAWPGFELQQNSDLATTNWINVSGSTGTVAGVNQLVLPPPAGNNFYRLVHP